MNKQPKFSIGDNVVYLGKKGTVTKVIPLVRIYHYMVKFHYGLERVPENRLRFS